MTTYITTGFAISENESGAAVSLSNASFSLVVADGATPSLAYTIASTSGGWVPVINGSFPNALDISVDGVSTNQSNFLDGPSDHVFLGDIKWSDGGSLQTTTVFGYWDDDNNTRYVFTIAGHALPSFADTTAYESWLSNDVIELLSAGEPYGPETPIDLSATGAFTFSADDLITGLEQSDVLMGGSGNDTLLGKGGNDVLIGGDGADTLDGGVGFDIADYLLEGGTSGVTGSLLTNTVTDSFGNIDTLISIEGFIGTHSADTFHGNGESNVFVGNAGSDRFLGYGGVDIVDYSSEIGGTGIQMKNNFFSSDFSTYDTFGNLDTGYSIEVIYATNYSDILRAQGHDTYYDALGGDDQVYAYTGDDTLIGGDGFDTLSGGEGNDFIDGGGTDAEDELYFGGFLVDSVIVDMENGIATSSKGHVDRFVNIFRVVGSHNGDHLKGSRSNNEFVGGSGYDTIDGGGGIDKVRYDLETGWSGRSGINANLDTGIVQGGSAGRDTLLNIEWVVGSHQSDTILGGADADTIEGHLGDDVLDGGDGIDTLSYNFSRFWVTVDLAVSTPQYTIGAGTDTISNFENILGSGFGDTLFGNGDDNVIQGGAGADTIDGRGNGPNGDTVSYENSDERVVVDLRTGTGSGGDAEGDQLQNIENLVGSGQNDRLIGSDIANSLWGGGRRRCHDRSAGE